MLSRGVFPVCYGRIVLVEVVFVVVLTQQEHKSDDKANGSTAEDATDKAADATDHFTPHLGDFTAFSFSHD